MEVPLLAVLLAVTSLISVAHGSFSIFAPPYCLNNCWEYSKFVTACPPSSTHCLCGDELFQTAVYQCINSQCGTSQIPKALHHALSKCSVHKLDDTNVPPPLIRRGVLHEGSDKVKREYVFATKTAQTYLSASAYIRFMRSPQGFDRYPGGSHLMRPPPATPSSTPCSTTAAHRTTPVPINQRIAELDYLWHGVKEDLRRLGHTSTTIAHITPIKHRRGILDNRAGSRATRPTLNLVTVSTPCFTTMTRPTDTRPSPPNNLERPGSFENENDPKLLETGRLSDVNFKSPNRRYARLVERQAEQSRVANTVTKPIPIQQPSSTAEISSTQAPISTEASSSIQVPSTASETTMTPTLSTTEKPAAATTAESAANTDDELNAATDDDSATATATTNGGFPATVGVLTSLSVTTITQQSISPTLPIHTTPSAPSKPTAPTAPASPSSDITQKSTPQQSAITGQATTAEQSTVPQQLSTTQQPTGSPSTTSLGSTSSPQPTASVPSNPSPESSITEQLTTSRQASSSPASSTAQPPTRSEQPSASQGSITTRALTPVQTSVSQGLSITQTPTSEQPATSLESSTTQQPLTSSPFSAGNSATSSQGSTATTHHSHVSGASVSARPVTIMEGYVEIFLNVPAHRHTRTRGSSFVTASTGSQQSVGT